MGLRPQMSDKMPAKKLPIYRNKQISTAYAIKIIKLLVLCEDDTEDEESRDPELHHQSDDEGVLFEGDHCLVDCLVDE